MFSVPCCFLFFPFRHLLLAQTVTTQRDHFCFLQSWVISNGVTSHPEQTWLRPRPHVGRLQRRGRPRCSWQGFLLGWKVPAGRQVGPGKKSCPPSTGLQWATAGSAGYTHPAYGCPRVRTLCSSRPYTFPNPEGSKTYIWLHLSMMTFPSVVLQWLLLHSLIMFKTLSVPQVVVVFLALSTPSWSWLHSCSAHKTSPSPC